MTYFICYNYLMHHSHKHLHKISAKKNKKKSHWIVLISSVIYPLTTLPQIIIIFQNQSAANISLVMYMFYIFFALIFLSYGITEKLKPVIVLQSLWLVMYSCVLIGILLYS